MEKIKVFELFAGIGSPRKALENINIPHESVGYSEIDKNAIKAYCQIHEDFPENNFGDITKIENYPQKIDLLCGGFPRQDISRAGLGMEIIKNETRSGLMFEMMKFIEKTKPKCILTENVKDFLNKKNKEQFDLYINFLQDLGYEVSFNVLNSKYFGVPQNRERVFIVANKGKKINLDFNNLKEADNLTDFVKFDSFEKEIYKVKQATKKGFIEVETPAVANLAFPNSKTRRGRAISKGKIVPTLQTSQEFYAIQHKNNDFQKRKLTAEECLILMGFTKEDYNKINNFSESQITKLAGNSIVVQVLEKIFISIYNLDQKNIKGEL